MKTGRRQELHINYTASEQPDAISPREITAIKRQVDAGYKAFLARRNLANGQQENSWAKRTTS